METIKETSFETVVDFTPTKLELNETVTTNDSQLVSVSEHAPKVEVKPENVLIDTFESLYEHVKSIHSEKVTPTNIVLIATELIQLVEKYKQLTGIQKRTLVINVIKKLVNSQIDTEEDKKAMNLIIDLTLPSVLDNLVNAINGNLKFDREKAKSFFRKYFCCLCK